MIMEDVNEDLLPEVSVEDRGMAIGWFLEQPFWRVLYAAASKQVRARLDVAFCVAEYKGRRNLWPLREERERVERQLTIDDLEFLVKRFPRRIGREHYGRLLVERRLDAGRTTESFAALTAGLPAWEAEICRRTLDRVLDIENPIMVDKALVWKAVGGGYDACALIGDCFLHGHEVERDVKIAAYWLEKAAPSCEIARENLSELKAEGLA